MIQQGSQEAGQQGKNLSAVRKTAMQIHFSSASGPGSTPTVFLPACSLKAFRTFFLKNL